MYQKCTDVLVSHASSRPPTSSSDRFFQHWNAYTYPKTPTERAIKNLIQFLATYGDDHARRLGAPIGHDGLLGSEGWFAVWQGARTLLNGELGRFDGALLSSLLMDLGHAAGFSDDELGR